MRTHRILIWVVGVSAVALALAGNAGAQVNTVNLSGIVTDPQGLAVQGAQLTAKSLATGAERTTASDAGGRYEIVGLPPGKYSLTVEALGFATLKAESLTLTLGVAAEYNPQFLQAKAVTQEVTVSASTELVDTGKSDVSTTVTQTQIDGLPINGRNYINFTLLNSQSARDTTPSIGAAPTSGLNFGGQRGRSNQVSVDGADADDNSVNGVRATVSQEAVQEFQVITSNYMPEYGRAMGGVVNIVTKSGTNGYHGDVFGFLRNGAIQARAPFSVTAKCNPACGITPVKQSYTRVQAGATIGGPIQKDKTFFFFSYEITRRQETGFTNIGANNFDLQPIAYPAAGAPPPLGCGLTQGLVTQSQARFLANPATPLAVGVPYFCAAAGSSATALFGNTSLLPRPIAKFPSSGAVVPESFVGLITTVGNFPISEGTSLYSLRLDHNWNAENTSFVRVNVSPSTVSGIQVNAQNQTFGQNSGSRTSWQRTRDIAAVGQHTTLIRNDLFNEARFQFARRGLHYGFSTLPGGSFPAMNIAGYAFIGREPFTTEDRVEYRYQATDDLTWTKGAHSLKFGADFNFIQLTTTQAQTFELNYGGVYDFASVSADSLPPFAGAGAPPFSAVQAYGLGLPTIFFQGIGLSNHPFNVPTLGVFAQDSRKINRRLTLNYGARYDIEWMPTFKPSGNFNPAAEKAFGVVEGIPTDSNNIAPRIGIAWDPWGNGKTVVRAGYGFFYDHPLLGIAFLSTAVDGSLTPILEAAGGAPGGFNATSIFQGILGPPFTNCSTAVPSACYLPNEQRFKALQPNSLFTNQNFMTTIPPTPLPLLPFTIPVRKDFQYALAQQANLTVEREFTKDWKISAGYNYTHGSHLYRSWNQNTTKPELLISNDNLAVLSGLVAPGTNPLLVQAPASGCINGPGGSVGTIAPNILGAFFPAANCVGAPTGFIGTPAVFNYFRPSGPNPSFAPLLPGGYNNGPASLVGLATLAGFPTGIPGVQVPWSDVMAQASIGSCLYNAFTLTVTKRFSQHFELQSGWTWSHAIDDSTDLTTLLAPQDNGNPGGERGNSTFDQRHRWITSAVYMSPSQQSVSGFWGKFFANFTVAPVFEMSSGRPYNILLGYDTNLDFGSSTTRPSFIKLNGASAPAGSTVSKYIPGYAFTPPDRCVSSKEQPFGPYIPVPSPPYGCVGTLKRNPFARPGYVDMDFRIAKTIPIHEQWNLQIIADAFNLMNRFNVSDVNPVCDPTAGSPTCAAGQPTAAYDPRTFQFALKVNF